MANPTHLVTNPILAAPLSSQPGSTHSLPGTNEDKRASFIPDDKPSDRFFKILVHLGIANEDGCVKAKFQYISLPELSEDELKRIKDWLLETFELDPKSHIGKPISIKALLNEIKTAILEKYKLPIDSLELVGSTVLYLIGIQYFQRAFSLLEFSGIESLLTVENYPEFTRKPNDYDIRFFMPKSNLGQLYDLKEDTIRIASKLSKLDPGRIQQSMLANNTVINDAKTKNTFSVLSLGNRDSKTLELIYIQDIARTRLFSINSLYYNLERPLNECDNVFLLCHYDNPWQALGDIFSENIYDDIPEFDDTGWPMLLSQIIRGKCCRKPGFQKKVLDQFLGLLDPSQSKSAQISDLIRKCVKNHHRNDGYAALCMMLNACIIFHRENPALACELTKTMTADLLRVFPTSFAKEAETAQPERILNIIFQILNKDPGSFNLVYALIQIGAFVYLSRTGGSRQCYLRKHDGAPAVEMKLEKGGYSLLIPFAPVEAFVFLEQNHAAFLSKDYRELVEDLLFNIDTDKAPADVASPLEKYWNHLNVDRESIIQIATRGLNSLGQTETGGLNPAYFIHYAMLSAIFRVCKESYNGKEFLKNVPITLSHAYDSRIQTKLVQDALAIMEETKRPDLAMHLKSFRTSEKTPLPKLCLTWLIALSADESEYSILTRTLLMEYAPFLTKEDHLQLSKSFLDYLVKRHPKNALPLLSSLMEHLHDEAYLWDCLFTIYSNIHKSKKTNEFQIHLQSILSILLKLAKRFEKPKELKEKDIDAHFNPLLEQIVRHPCQETEEIVNIMSEKLGLHDSFSKNLLFQLCLNALEKGGNEMERFLPLTLHITEKYLRAKDGKNVNKIFQLLNNLFASRDFPKLPIAIIKQISFNLIETFIRFPHSKFPHYPRFIPSILAHSQLLMGSLEEKDEASPRVLLYLKALQMQDIQLEYCQYDHKIFLSEITKYLNTNKVMPKLVADAEILIGHYLSLQQGEYVLEKWGCQIAFINTLIKHSHWNSACKWIQQLLDFWTGNGELKRESISHILLGWIPRLHKKKCLKKCMDIFTFLKTIEPSSLPEASKSLCSFIEELCSAGFASQAGDVLKANGDLLRQHSELENVTLILRRVIETILKRSPLTDELLTFVLELIKVYDIQGDLLNEALTLCVKSENRVLLQLSWDLFEQIVYKKSVEEPANFQQYSHSWLLGLMVLGKLDLDKYIDFLKKSVRHCFYLNTRDLKTPFYLEIIKITLNLPMSRVKFDCFCLFLEEHILNFVCTHQNAEEGFDIALKFTKAISASDKFIEYKKAQIFFDQTLFRMLRLGTSPLPPLVCETLNAIMRNSEKFIGNSEAEQELESLMFNLIDKGYLIPEFNILSVVPTLLKHNNDKITFLAAKTVHSFHMQNNPQMISQENKNHLKALTFALSKTLKQTVSELTTFLWTVKFARAPMIMKHLSKEDLQITFQTVYKLATARCLLSSNPQFIEAVLSSFIFDFHFIAKDNAIASQCIKAALETALDFTCRFKDQSVLIEFIFKFKEKLESDSTLELDSNRIAAYKSIILETLLESNEMDEIAALATSNIGKLLLEEHILKYSEAHKSFMAFFTKYIFFSPAYQRNAYQDHLANCSAIFMKLTKEKTLKNREKILSLDLFLQFSPPMVFDSFIQLSESTFTDICNDVCRLNSPVAVWHLIDSLKRLSTITFILENPYTLLRCFRIIADKLPEFDYFGIDDLPIFAFFAKTLLEIPALAVKQKSETWKDVSIKLMLEFIRIVITLIQKNTPKPAGIASNYELFPYLINTIYLAYKGFVFEGAHMEFLKTVHSILPLCAQYLQQHPDVKAKYSFFIKNMLIMADNKSRTLTASEIAFRYSVLIEWEKLSKDEK